MKVRTAALAVGLALATATAAGLALAQPAYIAAAVADSSRPATDTARDADRKPAQVLAFSGVKPGDTVIELMPPPGYYTRMLSKIVGPNGKVYAVIPARMLGNPAMADSLKAIGSNVVVLGSPTGAPTAEIPVKADLVWTTENYHDFHNGPTADIAAFDKAIYDALKPGGVFMVEDHAAANDAPPTVTSQLHRINPNQALSELQAAGFKLAARSNIMANPADDHTKGSGAYDREEGHGKTDKFLMKFQKPR